MRIDAYCMPHSGLRIHGYDILGIISTKKVLY
jgi:hypothetical protein